MHTKFNLCMCVIRKEINTFMYDGSVKNSSKVDFGTVALFAGILAGTAGLIKNVVKNLPKQ